MGKELTERTQRLIALIDSPDARAQITALFETGVALDGPPTMEESERVRFAVIKLALQDHRSFVWRPEAHEKWCKAMFAARTIV